jgi:hypothetical protein
VSESVRVGESTRVTFYVLSDHTRCIERERGILNIFSIFVRILEIFNYLSYNIHRLY